MLLPVSYVVIVILTIVVIIFAVKIPFSVQPAMLLYALNLMGFLTPDDPIITVVTVMILPIFILFLFGWFIDKIINGFKKNDA